MLGCDGSWWQIASSYPNGWDHRLIEGLLFPSPRFQDLPGDLQKVKNYSMQLHKGFDPIVASDGRRRQVVSACPKGWDHRLIIEGLLFPSPRFLDLPGDLQKVTKYWMQLYKVFDPIVACNGSRRQIASACPKGWDQRLVFYSKKQR